MSLRSLIPTATFLTLSLSLSVSAALSPEQTAARLFDRITGTPLGLRHPARSQMIELVQEGKLGEAAHLATEDDHFCNVTLRHWSAPLFDRNEDQLAPLADADAMVLGTVRDDRDFRELLTGDFTYVGPTKINNVVIPPATPGNNAHYATLEKLHLNLRQVLARREPQNPGLREAAGIFTSRAWALAHYNMGTNRRAVEYSFREFLCTPLDQMKDALMPDTRIHRDVDRSPGGSSQTYLSTCRSCHGGLDGLVGAFAYFRFGFQDGALGIFQDMKIQHKMNQNGEVYPDGYVTTDDSWVNNFTQNQNTTLDWRGPQAGHGARAFGSLIASTGAFSRCMAKRAFTELCHREPFDSEKASLDGLAQNFEQKGYRLRGLFESVATLPSCL